MRLRSKKRLLTVIFSLLMVIGLTACNNEKKYSFGTGNIGGNYYTYGNALAGLIQSDGTLVEVKTTAGSAANLRLLQKGFLDMAIVQSDTLLDAFNGNGSFAGNKCDGVRAIAGLYIEECQIVVSADSDIYSVDDLYGRNVSVGVKESGVMQNAEQILLANGINLNQINAFYMSFSDAAAALKSGEIDAFFSTAGAPTTSIQELAKEMDIRLVSLDEDTCRKLIEQYPCYTECTIPADTYQGQDESVNTLGVKAVLVVNGKVSDEFAEYLTNTLFLNNNELRYATAAEELNISFATDGIPVPFHAGAASWYQKYGLTVPTSSDEITINGVKAGQD